MVGSIYCWIILNFLLNIGKFSKLLKDHPKSQKFSKGICTFLSKISLPTVLVLEWEECRPKSAAVQEE